MNDRPSLRSAKLSPLWELVRQRLEQSGSDNRGRLRLPELTSEVRLVLGALLDRRPQATVDLGALERALQDLGVGPDLPSALAQLGYPVSDEPARRREERQVARAARDAARQEAARWPEPWSEPWIDDVIRSGCLRDMDAESAVGLVASARKLLDHLDDTVGRPTGGAGTTGGAGAVLTHAVAGRGQPRVARVDLAAQVLGPSHALDTGTRLEAATTRALAYRDPAGQPGQENEDPEPAARTVWERAGVHLDLTSAPGLTWRLPAEAGTTLGSLVEEANASGVPVHLSQFMLRRHPAHVHNGADILVVENPRLVEAAAQLGVDHGVVATNGNPSGAVQLLLDQLLESGARLRYHGDFDAAGLAICARMHNLGLTPWRMEAADYLAAVHQVEVDAVTLPRDPKDAPVTPWDPELRAAFDELHLVVHEERLLPNLFQTL